MGETGKLMSELADSLKGVIENGGNFNHDRHEYSADESNRGIGGDLGWFKEGQHGNSLQRCLFRKQYR
jgi:parvulin-like peptidyl-prolyl isomerase